MFCSRLRRPSGAPFTFARRTLFWRNWRKFISAKPFAGPTSSASISSRLKWPPGVSAHAARNIWHERRSLVSTDVSNGIMIKALSAALLHGSTRAALRAPSFLLRRSRSRSESHLTRALLRCLLDSAPQQRHLGGRKLPIMTLLEIAQIERTQPHAFHFFYGMFRRQERLPQQIAPRAAQFRLIPGILHMPRRCARRPKQSQPRLRLVTHL